MYHLTFSLAVFMTIVLFGVCCFFRYKNLLPVPLWFLFGLFLAWKYHENENLW